MNTTDEDVVGDEVSFGLVVGTDRQDVQVRVIRNINCKQDVNWFYTASTENLSLGLKASFIKFLPAAY